jgi:hypothetical protein
LTWPNTGPIKFNTKFFTKPLGAGHDRRRRLTLKRVQSNPKINKALNYSFQDLENISIDEEELIEAMKVINDQKYDV